MSKKSIPFFLALAALGVGAWFFLQHGVETASKTAAKNAVEDPAPETAAKSAQPESKAPATPPAPIDAATVGTIRGVVQFEGTTPERKAVFLAGFADCKALQQPPALEESLIVQDGKIQNAMVFVRKGLEGREFPLSEEERSKFPVMDQVACIYAPHVLAIKTGQTLEIRNSDALLHNVHSDSKRNQEFNLPMPRKGDKLEQKLDKAEIFSLRCDVHSWMRAWIGVFSHPFFQVTGADGRFELKGLPPGKYTIRVWHEMLGTQDHEVELKPSEEKTIDFRLKKN